MAETIKLPAIGPVKRQWVYIGGALIIGFVGYAWFNRSKEAPPAEAPLTEEEIPLDREPPSTVVGEESFEIGDVEVISNNAQWATAAISRLSDIGYDPISASVAVGKFLSRQSLSVTEREMIQGALGFLGPPPQGGPWSVIDAVPSPTPTPTPTPTPSGGSPGRLVGWHGHRMTRTASWRGIATFYANYPSQGDSVEATFRGIKTRNPAQFRVDPKNARKGWVILVPTPSVRKMGTPSF